MIKLAMSGKAFEEYPFEEMVNVLSSVGYAGVEIRTCDTQLPITITDEEARSRAEALAKHGLTTTCISTFTGDYSDIDENKCEEEFQKFARFVELSQILNARQVRHWAGRRASREVTEEQWARSVKWMQAAADHAATHDREVALELHHRSLLDQVDSILRYLHDVDRPNVVLLYDAENLYHDQVKYGRETVRTLGPYIGGVHIKDTVLLQDGSNPEAYEYRGKYFWRKLINEAGVDHYSVLMGLRDIGFDGFLTVETSGVLPDAAAIAKHEYDEVAKMVDYVWTEGTT